MRPDNAAEYSGQEIFYVAVGERARAEQAESLETLRRFSDLPVRVLDDGLPGMSDKQSSRWHKLSLDVYAKTGRALYLDADTRIYQGLSAGWQILDDGWDLAIAPSMQQGPDDCLWHVKEPERGETLETLGYLPLQLQAGVMFIRWTERTRRLWYNWRLDWLKYKDEDQAALLRALAVSPVRVWLLGYPWNGGAVIGHLCGRVRH